MAARALGMSYTELMDDDDYEYLLAIGLAAAQWEGEQNK